MTNVSNVPRSLLRRLAPLALLAFAGTNLYAAQPISISLTGEAEVPPVVTSATATGQIIVLPDHTVTGSIKTSGLAPTAAHIHEAAAGKNGPPIITLEKSAADSFTVPDGAKLTDAQYASYVAGILYINVHSAEHPNGEIRTQLRSTK